MEAATGATTVGGRVRHWRVRRGLSQTQLAQLAGVTQSYVSQVENGVRQLERRATMTALAQALQVDVANLLGQPGDPGDPARSGPTSAIPQIRLELLMAEEGIRPKPSIGEEELASMLADADECRAHSRYSVLAKELPRLLRQAAGHGGIPLVRAASAASVTLRRLEYRDLSRAASQIALNAALDHGDPGWVGSARFFHMLSWPVEADPLIAPSLEGPISEMQAAAGDPRARQMLGQLHLTAARAAASSDPEAALGHLAAAQDEALTLGDPPDGRGFDLLAFGPTNVNLWRMTVLVELGQLEEADRLAEQVTPDPLRIGNRHRAYWTTRGKAASLRRRDDEALRAFVRAEALGPEVFPLDPMVRDAVHVMVQRARRRAVSRPLRNLANRVGVEV